MINLKKTFMVLIFCLAIIDESSICTMQRASLPTMPTYPKVLVPTQTTPNILSKGIITQIDRSLITKIANEEVLNALKTYKVFPSSSGIFRSTMPKLMSRAQARVLLEVSSDATPEQIKYAFKKAAFKDHPDRGGNKEAMQNLLEAKDLLLNSKRESIDYTENSSSYKSTYDFDQTSSYKEHYSSRAQSSTLHCIVATFIGLAFGARFYCDKEARFKAITPTIHYPNQPSADLPKSCLDLAEKCIPYHQVAIAASAIVVTTGLCYLAYIHRAAICKKIQNARNLAANIFKTK